jgi:hypothetical protein
VVGLLAPKVLRGAAHAPLSQLLSKSIAFTISKTRFFNSESASIFFSSVFFFSSSFSRLASAISIMPNLHFQRWKVRSAMFFSRRSSTCGISQLVGCVMGKPDSMLRRRNDHGRPEQR